MSRPRPVGLALALACLLGLASEAGAGVTIDIHFQDQSGRTLPIGDPGSGCVFTGYHGGSVTSGHCMDLILKSTFPLISINAYVTYGTDNGLAVGSFYEWRSVGVSFNMEGTPTKSCIQFDGVSDDGSRVGNFDCSVPAPNEMTTPLPAGTYRIGTIIWDTSALTPGTQALWIDNVIVGAVIAGNVVDYSSQVVIMPEPGTAALLGLGLVGLVLTTRRRRPPAG